MGFDLLLANFAKHVSLTQEESDHCISLFRTRSLKADEYLLREGEICRFETFVTKGCLKTYYQDKDGIDHIMDFSIEEWWADDLYSFFTQTAARSNIKAIENSEVLQISKTDLETLYKEVPKLERFFRILFQHAYITQRERINLILSTPAEERYLLFIKRKPYAEKRFSQKDIAAYLGITPQFLSTMKKKMRALM